MGTMEADEAADSLSKALDDFCKLSKEEKAQFLSKTSVFHKENLMYKSSSRPEVKKANYVCDMC